MKRNESFILIEILVVIVIIGILSAFIIVSLANTSAKARIAKSQAFATSLKNSLLLNLVAEWKMDEGSGATVNDKWGTYNGTLTNGDWKSGAECISGSCLYFSGDDYIIVSGLGFSLPNYVEKYGMSLTAWIKTSSAAAQSVVSQDSNSGCTYSCAGGLYIMSNKATAIIYDGSAYQYIYSTSVANDNNWHYLVASFNNDHKVRIYFDGKEENSQTLTDYANYNPVGITIGYLKEGSKNYNNVIGYLDEVRVFNEAVSETRVRSDYYAHLNELLVKKAIIFDDYLSRILELKT